MKPFENKVKSALQESAKKAPDYWEQIAQKGNIPYNAQSAFASTPKSKVRKLRYVVPAVAGIALVATLSFTNFAGFFGAPSGEGKEAAETAVILNLNNIQDSISAKIALPENGTTEMLSYEAYLEKAGMDLQLWLSEGMTSAGDGFVYYNADGSIFMMSGYAFMNPDTGASLNIRFQKDALPMTDLKYLLEGEALSTINGTDIVIGFSSDLNAYMTSFMYDGNGYEVTGNQMSQEDFVKVLQSIVQ